MNNKEAFKRFVQTNGVMIEKLFWIAGSLDSSELKELFSYNCENEKFESIFPGLEKIDLDFRSDDLSDYLIDLEKLGFVAEIHIPTCDHFSFENDSPKSWATHKGICRIEFTYAESTDELLSEIEIIFGKVFHEFVTKARKEKSAIENFIQNDLNQTIKVKS